jgi:hypothetical protein
MKSRSASTDITRPNLGVVPIWALVGKSLAIAAAHGVVFRQAFGKEVATATILSLNKQQWNLHCGGYEKEKSTDQ